MSPSSQGASVPVVQAQPAPVQTTGSGGSVSHNPFALQYPEQQPGQLSPQLQVASQPPPLSVQGGGPQMSAGWQLPGPPGTDGSVRQQMRPSSHAPSPHRCRRSLHRCRAGARSSPRQCRCPPHPELPAHPDSRRAQHRSSPGHRRCNRSPRRCMVGVRTGPRVDTSRPHRESTHRPGSRPVQHRSCAEHAAVAVASLTGAGRRGALRLWLAGTRATGDRLSP